MLKDLEHLLEGEKLIPKLFVTYLRMIKHWQDIQETCNEQIVRMKFGKDRPKWAGKERQPSKIVVIDYDEVLDDTDLKNIANADHVFIPIIRKPKEKKASETEEEKQERTQVYMVHLQPQHKKANIFTSAFYDDEGSDGSEFEDGIEFAKIELVDVIMKYRPTPTNQVDEKSEEHESSDSDNEENKTENTQNMSELAKQTSTKSYRKTPKSTVNP